MKKSNINKDLNLYSSLFSGNSTNEKDLELNTILVKFMYIFNIYEREMINEQKYGELKKTKFLIKNKENIYNIFFFFLKRYVKENKITQSFWDLYTYGKDKKAKQKIINILLKGKENNLGQMFEASLSISYRFRNNLYHGNKRLEYFGEYTNCFEKIIDFIYRTLKTYSRYKK